MRFLWRLSAFVGSAAVLAAHVAHEHFRLASPARTTAWHASVAAGFGGLAIALSANVHEISSAADYRPRMLVALVAWPLLTGVPAFLIARIAAAVLGRRHARA